MMGLNDFIDHKSKINSIFDIRTHLELNAINECMDLIEYKEWQVLLEDSYS
jgi:hypothetical protein